MKHYLLRPCVNIEPLVSRWYAWSYLIAPHTAAMNIVSRHLKIMQSYVQAPALHVEALAVSSMKGGPFLDIPVSEAHQIEKLLAVTTQDCKSLIDLAEATWKFDNFLQTNTDGTSLEFFYQNLPLELRGVVELVYDLRHRPQIRFIEPLIYNKYYQEELQEICLTTRSEEQRPFSLSTPKINQPDQLILDIPFAHSAIDELAKLRLVSGDIVELMDQLNLDLIEKKLFKNFFVEVEPSTMLIKPYEGEGVRIRYFGHACVLLETQQTSILIDPAVSYHEVINNDRFNFKDLPLNIDYVLLTHNHQDHVMFETLLQLRHRIKNIVIPRSNIGILQDPSLKLILKHIGFKNIIDLDEFEKIDLLKGCIQSLPFLGEHADLNIQTKASYYVNLNQHKFLFLADSNNLDPILYKNIFSSIGPIDTLFIGMECKGAPLSWLYGAFYDKSIDRKIDVSRRLSGSDCNKALDIVIASSCKQVFVYAMGQEPWLNYIMAVDYTPESKPILESNNLINQCHQSNIAAERLYFKKEWHVA